MKFTRTALLMITIVTLFGISLSGCKSTAIEVETPVPVEDNMTVEAVRPTNTPEPVVERPTATPRPTQVPDTPTPLPTPTPAPTMTPEETSAAQNETPTPELSPSPTEQATSAVIAQPFPKAPAIIATNALALVPNVDPGPPFSVEVSANHLLEGYIHRISGTIRNDSNETYAGLGVIATFFMEEGRNRYGPVNSNVKCLLLAPGASCPFIVEVTSKFLTEVILHTTGYPTPRTPLAPEYWGVSYYTDSIGYVHITGTVRNQYTVPARHVTVVGSLVNAQGEIVNVDATILLESVVPGGTAPFEIRIKYAPFRSVAITAQAEP